MRSLKVTFLILAVCFCNFVLGQSVVQPSIFCSVRNDISTTEKPDLYRAIDTNLIDVTVNPGSFADTVVSLEFEIKKDGMPISNLSSVGYLSISIQGASGTFASTFHDTTYKILGSTGSIPSSDYGYSYGLFANPIDGISLGMFNSRKIVLRAVWYKPGNYTVEWKLYKRNIASAMRATVSTVTLVSGSTRSSLIKKDVFTMHVKVPDFTLNMPTEMDVNDTDYRTLELDAESYLEQNGYLGYQLMYAPAGSSSYTDVTNSSFETTYGSVLVEAKSAGSTVYSGTLGSQARIHSVLDIQFGTLASYDINLKATWLTAGNYRFLFWTIRKNGSANDTLRNDTISFKVKSKVFPKITFNPDVAYATSADTVRIAKGIHCHVDVNVTANDFADTLGKLYYIIKRNGVAVSNLSAYGNFTCNGVAIADQCEFPNTITKISNLDSTYYFDIEPNDPAVYDVEVYVKHYRNGVPFRKLCMSKVVIKVEDKILPSYVILPDFTNSNNGRGYAAGFEYTFVSRINTGDFSSNKALLAYKLYYKANGSSTKVLINNVSDYGSGSLQIGSMTHNMLSGTDTLGSPFVPISTWASSDIITRLKFDVAGQYYINMKLLLLQSGKVIGSMLDTTFTSFAKTVDTIQTDTALQTIITGGSYLTGIDSSFTIKFLKGQSYADSIDPYVSFDYRIIYTAEGSLTNDTLLSTTDLSTYGSIKLSLGNSSINLTKGAGSVLGDVSVASSVRLKDVVNTGIKLNSNMKKPGKYRLEFIFREWRDTAGIAPYNTSQGYSVLTKAQSMQVATVSSVTSYDVIYQDSLPSVVFVATNVDSILHDASDVACDSAYRLDSVYTFDMMCHPNSYGDTIAALYYKIYKDEVAMTDAGVAQAFDSLSISFNGTTTPMTKASASITQEILSTPAIPLKSIYDAAGEVRPITMSVHWAERGSYKLVYTLYKYASGTLGETIVKDSAFFVVKTADTTFDTLTIKPSELPYTWNSLSLTDSGSYSDILVNQYGCDSICNLKLYVKELPVLSYSPTLLATYPTNVEHYFNINIDPKDYAGDLGYVKYTVKHNGTTIGAIAPYGSLSIRNHNFTNGEGQIPIIPVAIDSFYESSANITWKQAGTYTLNLVLYGLGPKVGEITKLIDSTLTFVVSNSVDIPDFNILPNPTTSNDSNGFASAVDYKFISRIDDGDYGTSAALLAYKFYYKDNLGNPKILIDSISHYGSGLMKMGSSLHPFIKGTDTLGRFGIPLAFWAASDIEMHLKCDKEGTYYFDVKLLQVRDSMIHATLFDTSIVVLSTRVDTIETVDIQHRIDSGTYIINVDSTFILSFSNGTAYANSIDPFVSFDYRVIYTDLATSVSDTLGTTDVLTSYGDVKLTVGTTTSQLIKGAGTIPGDVSSQVSAIRLRDIISGNVAVKANMFKAGKYRMEFVFNEWRDTSGSGPLVLPAGAAPATKVLTKVQGMQVAKVSDTLGFTVIYQDSLPSVVFIATNQDSILHTRANVRCDSIYWLDTVYTFDMICNPNAYPDTMAALYYSIYKDGVAMTDAEVAQAFDSLSISFAGFSHVMTKAAASMTQEIASYAAIPLNKMFHPVTHNIRPITLSAAWKERGVYTVDYALVRYTSAGMPTTDTLVQDVAYFVVGNPDITYDTITVGLSSIPYTWHSQTLTATGDYIDTMSSIGGCDSIIMLRFNRVDSVLKKYDTTLCEGGIAYIKGFYVICATGQYHFEHKDTTKVGGYDSTTVLNVTVNPKYRTILPNDTTCIGIYSRNGFLASFTTNGVYPLVRIEQSVQGCDSMIVMMLFVSPNFVENYEEDVCAGERYRKYGFDTTLTTPGVYDLKKSYTSIYGCDSTINLTLNVYPLYSDSAGITRISERLCRGAMYVKNGFSIATIDSVPGTYNYQKTFKTVHGCDSVVYLQLTINDTVLRYFTAEICEGSHYKANGFDIYPKSAGTYHYVNVCKSYNACDSTAVLDLTVNPVYERMVYDDICAGERYYKYGFDTILTTPGIYDLKKSYISINGCDSSINLKLTVYPSYSDNAGITRISERLCRGAMYVKNGFSIATIDSVPGIYNYQKTFKTIHGCDSVVYLQLTINDTVLKHFTAEICEGSRYTANGFNVYPKSAGKYRYVNARKSYNACDSTAVLDLTVNPVYKRMIYDDICAGERYRKYGFDTLASVNGTRLIQHLYTSKGCDSIITVALTVYPKASNSIYDNICRSEGRYVKNGFNFILDNSLSSMVERMTFKSQYGCDSVVTLYLTINDGGDTTINVTVCTGERYRGFGIDTIIYAAGTYNFNRVLKSANGCDSIINMTMLVKPSYTEYVSISTCGSDSVVYDGNSYGPGLHKIVYPSTATRCDSVVWLTVNSFPIVRDTFNVNLCRNSQPSYLFGNRVLTQTGVYYDTIPYNNCYKITVLNLLFSDTVTRPLSIHGPINIYQAGSYTYFVDTVPGATNYIWETTDVTWIINANKETAVIDIPTPGSGTIYVSASNVCGASSKQFLQVFSAVSVNDAEVDNAEVSIFPNPANTEYNVRINGIEGRVLISIADVSGKIVAREYVEVSPSKNIFSFTAGDYARGIYLVTISNEKQKIVKKLIIQ